MISQLRWCLDQCVCAGAEGWRAAPPRSQPGAVAALTVFSGAAAIAGLRRGIQCGMGRSWGGHGLSRNTDCPPLPTCPPLPLWPLSTLSDDLSAGTDSASKGRECDFVVARF